MQLSNIVDFKAYEQRWRTGWMRSYDPFVNAFSILGADMIKHYVGIDYGESGCIELYKEGQMIGYILEEDFPSCTIIGGTNRITGNGYSWVSDGDGSLDRLRAAIHWR